MSVRLAGIIWCVSLATGCLAAPPTYEERRQIPPAIVKSLVVPSLDAIVEVLDGDGVEFKAPFHSEDLGERLQGRFHIDFKPGERLGASRYTSIVAPSTLDDDTRAFEGRIEADDLGTPGCHSVTLIAAHESQFASNNEPDESKVDRITWWVHFPGESGREVLLIDCITGREEGP